MTDEFYCCTSSSRPIILNTFCFHFKTNDYFFFFFQQNIDGYRFVMVY